MKQALLHFTAAIVGGCAITAMFVSAASVRVPSQPRAQIEASPFIHERHRLLV